MAAKKTTQQTVEKTAKRYAKKAVKRIHTATKVLVVLTLLVGIAAGAVVCLHFSKNDRFVLQGQTVFSIDMVEGGAPYLYTEEGVEAYCFGLDASSKLMVETDLQQDAAVRYIIPVDKEGVYTIVYTVDCLKFGEKAPNGVIKRIRTFTVIATEEDGIYG